MVEIYADILILLNFIIDFFLLNLTAKLSNYKGTTIRLILGSLFASLFSLYIFLPSQDFFIEMLLRMGSSATVILVCFGYKSIKVYLKRLTVFFCVSFLFAGAMIGVWFLFKPSTMALNNGVVYFNFSPLLLVVATAICYFSICIFRIVFKPESAKAEKIPVTVILNNKNVPFVSAVDTGNSLKDPITNIPVIVADKLVIKQLIGKSYDDFIKVRPNEYFDRYRVIPINTVGGEGLLPAIKCDYLKYKNKLIVNPVIAESRTRFSDDYDAVINPEILEV